MKIPKKTLKIMKQRIKDSKVVVITAGAGMGVDSGLPDFRGNEGFWNAYPPLQKRNINFMEMANPIWFYREPELAWGFYGHRLNLYRDTIPHKGFSMLLDLVKSKKDYFIFTSNVDGQFQKAGFDDDKIMEVHGTIHKIKCSGQCKGTFNAPDEVIDIDENLECKDYPKCSSCNRAMRPNILMFSDGNYDNFSTAVKETNFIDFKEKYKDDEILVIEIGAGTAIPTVRSVTESFIKDNKNTVIRINPRECFNEYKDILGYFEFESGALDSLEKIL